MAHFRVIVLTSAACLLTTLPLLARDKAPADLYTTYNGFTLPPEPILPAHETHPSLWFKSADLPKLRASFSADEFSRTRWAATQKLADLAKPLPSAPTAKDKTSAIHQYYGAASQAARAHALLALFANDAAARSTHRQRAEDLLLRAYDGPIFDLDSNVKSSAVDEIYRGSWLQNYAHAYDCIQPTLTAEADQKIRAHLALEAECVYTNLYLWTETSPHNHLSKPAWGLGSIALALSSHPHARLWLGRALEATNKNTAYFFSGDGLYREGSHYLIFSLTNFVPFLYHYRNVSGVDGFTAFQPVFEAMVQVRNSHGWLPNIEDAYLRPTPTHLVAAAYRQRRTSLHSTAPLSEILTWSYQTCDLAPFEKERGDSGFNYTGASWDYPLEIDELLTHDASIAATPPDTNPNIFLSSGQTILRNRWTGTNEGQRYLLFHGMAVADNHNHDDQLSFMLQAEGQMMCADSGYSRGTYAGSERTDWYATAAAHNTFTFDGKPAGRDASNVTPTTFQLEQSGLVVVEKSTALPQSGSWSRLICWIAGDYYAVIDRVDSPQTHELKSYLHGGRGTLTTPEKNERTWDYSSDRYGPAAKLRSWIAAPGATTEVKQGELTYIKGDYAEFPYLVTFASAQSAPWITLLKPTAATSATAFDVQDRSTPTLSAFAISTPDHQTLVAARTKDSPAIKIGELETDATFVLLCRDLSGKIISQYSRDASYLRVAGHNLTP